MGTTATLRIDDLPAPWPTGRQITLECPHGTTQLAAISPEGEVPSAEQFGVKAALLKHYRERCCPCIQHLWRQHFGCALGELVVAQGEP